MSTVQLPALGIALTVEPGQTILDAALTAGVPYPHGCRAGNCGACKSRLLSGETDLIPYSEYALSDAERAEGLILACRATPWEDCAVAWLESDEVVVHPVMRLPFRVTAVDKVAAETVRVRAIALDATEWVFSAGQYAEVAFGDRPPRNFSMANAPAVEHDAGRTALELHVRVLPDGRVSRFVRDELRVGDRLEVRGPFGAAHLRSRHTGPLLLMAGGTGLAPVLSIARTALRERPTRPLHLYMAARNASFVYGLDGDDGLRRLASDHPSLRIVVALSDEGAEPAPIDGVTVRRGFAHEVVAADVAAGALSLDGVKAYVAGPPAMVDAVRAALIQAQLPVADLHADAFYTGPEQAALNSQQAPGDTP